ncbi:hypothetical protein [Evansella halocellulosilytica]|uniref:hypothetical protein n=1 Tax=Evansella halocellulosilytica TaxID=2011013 RepID=UPI0015CE0C9C|nr:hypothetical protein [Evansella halocellulosilytica]
MRLSKEKLRLSKEKLRLKPVPVANEEDKEEESGENNGVEEKEGVENEYRLKK